VNSNLDKCVNQVSIWFSKNKYSLYSILNFDCSAMAYKHCSATNNTLRMRIVIFWEQVTRMSKIWWFVVGLVKRGWAKYRYWSVLSPDKSRYFATAHPIIHNFFRIHFITTYV
jgi:hypothetical protein